jgi:hypothetical protein
LHATEPWSGSRVAEAFRIEPPAGDHGRSNFVSGSEALDRYFQTQVSQDLNRRIATCFVAVGQKSQEIAGYYTLAATSVALSAFSPEIAKKLPRYPVVPAVLLGRLAVARSYQVCLPWWLTLRTRRGKVFMNIRDSRFWPTRRGAYVFRSRPRFSVSRLLSEMVDNRLCRLLGSVHS